MKRLVIAATVMVCMASPVWAATKLHEISWEDVKNVIGADEMKNIPLGAVGIYSYAEKIRVGLQQLMAGARCFSTPTVTRRELMSLTEECAKVTGIPYLMDAYREEAMEILKG